MTKNFSLLLLSCCLLSLPLLFNSCIKDTCTERKTYRVFTPVYKALSLVREEIKSSAARPVGQPGKIYIRGNYIFLNDVDRGIHVIDNTDPSSPRNISFIPIPGNMDLAVKGNILYADMYNELLSIDISDPLAVTLVDYKPGIFLSRQYQAGFQAQNGIIVDWIEKDTMQVSECEMPGAPILYDYVMDAMSNSGSTSPFGAGGSMARFTILNDRLYTVSANTLDVLDISTPAEPQHKSTVALPWGIETIFPFRDELFIGSQQGMFRFNVADPDLPVQTGQFAHVRSCDPVIADDQYAYVTLRSGTACQGFTNQLDILDLANPAPGQEIRLLATHQMTNPHGLGKEGDLLFLCDGAAGLRIFNVSDIQHLELLRTIDMEAYDVIPFGKRILVMAKDGLYQFDYSVASDIRLLSRLAYN